MTVPAQTYRVYSLPYALNSTQRYFSSIAEQFASPVLLQSDALAADADRRGRFDILVADPLFAVSIFADHVAITGDVPASFGALSEAEPLQALHTLLTAQSAQRVVGYDDLPFVGGFVGYLSYDYGRLQHGLWKPKNDSTLATLPLAQMRYYPWALVVDHQLARCSVVFSEKLDDVYVAQLLDSLSQQVLVTEATGKLPQFTACQTKPQYLDSITRIHDYINAGDCYQVNYAQCFTAAYSQSALALYWQLQTRSPAPFSAFYTVADDAAILSFSPERFVALSTAGELLTQPIKGTIARSLDSARDQANAQQLQRDEKNRAENLMIVDLLRNDFGRIAEIGSVKVSKLFELQSFSNVHHLVSSIDARLASDYSAAAIWQHCFPGGSITGAPKRRAMEIIDELEVVPRSIYCGSIAYHSDCGRTDSSILIRSILRVDQQLYCWGGGGIVADSSAEAEYQESLTKINRLINS